MIIPLWALIPLVALAIVGLITILYLAMLAFMKHEYRNSNFPPR